MAIMMTAMTLLGILFIGGIVALVVWVVRELLPQRRRGEDEAVSILDQRFARGEIDRDEYQTRRRELQNPR